MQVNAKIDLSGLNRGVQLGMLYTKRTPAQVCNTTGLEVAIGAKNNMPFVTVERIDTELAVIVTPKIGKRGKPLKRGKNYTGGLGTSRNPDVPLAVLIMQARSNPNSRYNQLTNNRYALSGSPFKGVSPATGRAAMAALIHTMVANRHRSGHFLMAGWIPAIKALLPYTANRYRRGGSRPLDGAKSAFGSELGDAKPALEGDTRAACVIENLIGYEGKNAASFDRALQLYGVPGLQQSVDTQGVIAMNYYLKKSSDAELVKPFNDACK
jgi:hypothetical protein